MPAPNLLHPIDIELEQIDMAGTSYDDDARSPVQHVARKVKVRLSGQVKWVTSMGLEAQRAGVVENESGYVLFRYGDLQAKSITLGRGDRLTGIDREGGKFYITRLQPKGHYPGLGATLVRAYFEDHAPARA